MPFMVAVAVWFTHTRSTHGTCYQVQ